MKGKKELQHRGTAAAGVCSPGAPRGSEQPVLYPTRMGGGGKGESVDRYNQVKRTNFFFFSRIQGLHNVHCDV